MSLIDENTKIKYHKTPANVIPKSDIESRKPLVIIEFPISTPKAGIVSLKETIDKFKEDYHILTLEGTGKEIKYIIVGETMEAFDGKKIVE